MKRVYQNMRTMLIWGFVPGDNMSLICSQYVKRVSYMSGHKIPLGGTPTNWLTGLNLPVKEMWRQMEICLVLLVLAFARAECAIKYWQCTTFVFATCFGPEGFPHIPLWRVVSLVLPRMFFSFLRQDIWFQFQFLHRNNIIIVFNFTKLKYIHIVNLSCYTHIWDIAKVLKHFQSYVQKYDSW